MGEKYDHLTLEERCRLRGMIEMGLSKAEMARKYWSAKGENRYRIITFEGCFHGRTISMVSPAAYNRNLVDGFGPMLDGFDIVPVDGEAARNDPGQS